MTDRARDRDADITWRRRDDSMADRVRKTLGRDVESAFKADLETRPLASDEFIREEDEIPRARPAPQTRIHEIKPLSAKFRADPVQALKDAIPPHHKPSDIDDFDRRGLLTGIVEHLETAEKTARIEQADPEFDFIERVKGYLIDMSTTNRGLNESLDLPITTASTTQVFGARAQPAANPQTGVGAFQIDRTEGDEDLQYARQVLNGMDTTMVLGKLEMTREMRVGVDAALAELRMTNYRKFVGKQREDFYPESTAKDILAHLTALEMTLIKIRNPRRYVLTIEETNVTSQIKRKCEQMDREFVWDEHDRYFKQADLTQHEKNSQDIASRKLIERAPRRY